MCSYRCDSPSNCGPCVNEPFFTSASIVTSGTPWFSTTITSSPFGSVVALNVLLQLGALRDERGGSARADASDRERAARIVQRRVRAVASRSDPWFLSPSQCPILSLSNASPLVSTPAHLRRNEPLAPYTTFKIGGPADLFYEPTSADALANAVLAAREAGVPYFVLGLGANVLDRRSRLSRPRHPEHGARTTSSANDGDSCHLWTESGAIVKDLIQESVARGWSGLEHYVGIPSTVGGAIWQNLHFLSPAPERERTMFIAEVFESCEILSEENERKVVGADYVKFGYDDTVFHHRATSCCPRRSGSRAPIRRCCSAFCRRT